MVGRPVEQLKGPTPINFDKYESGTIAENKFSTLLVPVFKFLEDGVCTSSSFL